MSPTTTKRASTQLTLRLISEIANSVEVFKPSASLYALSLTEEGDGARDSSTIQKPPVEIDLVVSGGGLKGYFACGALAVLEQHLLQQNMRISRVSGASAGAWSALFICTGLSTEWWVESYHMCVQHPDKTLHEVYEEILWPRMLEMLPEDAYKLCNGRMHISITFMNGWGFENKIINQFTSNDDLFQACLASSTIPYITERGKIYRMFRGRCVLDGGLTNNTPIFPDGVNRQLVMRLSEVEYPWRLLINPLDSCIDALILRGAMQMARFIGGDRFITIQWLEKKQTEKDLMRPNILRRIVAPFAVVGIILWRSIGISNILDFLETFSAAKAQISDTIVPFHQGQEQFQEGTVSYALRALYTNLISILGNFNLLV